MANKDFSVTYYQGKTLMTINVKKLKIASFIKKNAKNRDGKKLITIPLPLETAEIYYQTLEEVP